MRIVSPRQQRGNALAVVIGLVAVLALAAFFIFRSDGGEQTTDPSLIYTAGRERLRITVVESGQLSASESEDIYSQIRGTTTILKLIDEGTVVEEGDVLVELDASFLEDEQTAQEIKYEQAKAAHIQATEAKAIQESTNASNISQAELALALAEKDLKKYIDGDWPMQQEEATENIKLAELELKNAEQTVADTQELYDLDFAAKTELDRDKLAFERAKVTKHLREQQKIILETYQYDRDLKVLEWDVQEYEAELERVKRRAHADLAQKVADLASKKATLDLEKDKLDRIVEQLDYAIVRAPTAGLVVYPVNASSRRGSSDRDRVEEGGTVRERQLLISLPDTEQMLAELKVHESAIDKVRVGQAAMVTVDAIPDDSFFGQVNFVAPLPDSANQWLNPDLKEYRVEVALQGGADILRPGMSISCEILVDELVDALAIPVHAVHRSGSTLFVYLEQGGEPVIREVEVGLNNESRVAIMTGLEDGDRVYLAVPPGAPEPEFDEEDNEIPADEWRAAADKVPVQTASRGGGPDGPGGRSERGERGGRDGGGREGGGRDGGGREGGMGGMDAAAMQKWQNATPEERQRMTDEFMKNLSPEQRKRMEEMRKQYGGGSGGGQE